MKLSSSRGALHREPVKAEDLTGARVRAATGATIQTGENWWFPAGMAAAILAGASDHAMPDLMKIGGVTGCYQPQVLLKLRDCQYQVTSLLRPVPTSWR